MPTPGCSPRPTGHPPWVPFPSSRPFVVPPLPAATAAQRPPAPQPPPGTLRSGLTSPSGHSAQGCAGDRSPGPQVLVGRAVLPAQGPAPEGRHRGPRSPGRREDLRPGPAWLPTEGWGPRTFGRRAPGRAGRSERGPGPAREPRPQVSGRSGAASPSLCGPTRPPCRPTRSQVAHVASLSEHLLCAGSQPCSEHPHVGKVGTHPID